MAATQQIILRANVRLLSLIGPGGVGKTRLGIYLAKHVATAFADGVFFVWLAPLSDAAQVEGAIAQALSVPDVKDRSTFEQVCLRLRERHVLLILDNFEHVSAAADLVSRLLRTCPHIKIIVTSREALHLRGEYEFVVSPLAVPSKADVALLKTGALLPTMPIQHASVSLFLDRALAVRPELPQTPENLAAISEICSQLDGLPLAIELAAARIKLFSPQMLLTHLRQDHTETFQVLTGGARDLPERQRTLRAAIQWGYDLLTPDEQHLFCYLSLFIDDYTLDEALDYVGSDKMAILGSLIDKSLLQRRSAPGEPQFNMLKTIREFAEAVLATSSEASQLRQRHADYFLTRIELLLPQLRGPEQVKHVAELERSIDNLRVTFNWYVAQGQTENTLRMAVAFGEFWYRRGYLRREACQLLDKALLQPQSDHFPSLQARAYNWLAYLTFERQDAVGLYAKGLECARLAGDQKLIGTLLRKLGVEAHIAGHFREALVRYAEALPISSAAEDQEGMAWTLNNMGLAHHELDELDLALPAYERCLHIAQSLGDKHILGECDFNLGLVALRQGDYERAAAYFEHGIPIVVELHMLHGIGLMSTALALTRYKQGDLGAANRLLKESLHYFLEYEDIKYLVHWLECNAYIAAAQQRPDQAACLIGSAEALRETAGDPLVPGDHVYLNEVKQQLQGVLPATAYDAAFAQGRSIPIAQVVEREQARLASDLEETHESPIHKKPAPQLPGGLTPREVEVLRWVAEGMTDAEIASALFISARTVNSHLNSIFSKLNVNSRTAAAKFAFDNKLL